MSPFVNWSFLQAETPPTQTAGAKGGSVKVHIPLVALKIGESGPQNIFSYVFLIKFIKSGSGWNCQPCFLLSFPSFQNSEAVKILYNVCHLIMFWLKRENNMRICLISSTLWLQVSQNSSSSVKTFFDGQMAVGYKSICCYFLSATTVGYQSICWFFIGNWPFELIKFRPSYLPQHLPQHVKKVNFVPGQSRVGGIFVVGRQKNRICQRKSRGS